MALKESAVGISKSNAVSAQPFESAERNDDCDWLAVPS
jgi:hypothetical protein